VFKHLLHGVKVSTHEVEGLVHASERDIPYSYSDLVDRLVRAVLREAQRRDRAVTVELVLECLGQVEPSPLMESHR